MKTALLLALALTWIALPARAAWRPDRFVIGGSGVNDASTNLQRLVWIDAAGFDFVGNMDHQGDLPLGRKLAAQVDSLHAARPGFGLEVIFYHVDPGDPAGRIARN